MPQAFFISCMKNGAEGHAFVPRAEKHDLAECCVDTNQSHLVSTTAYPLPLLFFLLSIPWMLLKLLLQVHFRIPA